MLDALCRRFPWLRTPLAVHPGWATWAEGRWRRRSPWPGSCRCSRCCWSAIAVLGFVSANDTDFPQRVVEQLGLTGRAADRVLEVIANAEDSRRAASLVGLLGLPLGRPGRGRHAGAGVQRRVAGDRPRLQAKLVDLAWLAGAGLIFFASLALGPGRLPLPGPAGGAHGRVRPGPRPRPVPVDVPRAHQRRPAVARPPARGDRRGDRARGAQAGGHGVGAADGGVVVRPLRLAGRRVRHPRLARAGGPARCTPRRLQRPLPRAPLRHGHGGDQGPRIEGEVPLEANRGGAVAETATPPTRRRAGRPRARRSRRTGRAPGLRLRCHTPCLPWQSCLRGRHHHLRPPRTWPCATPWPRPRSATPWHRSRSSWRPTTWG